jgi:hypothetical protein
VILTERDLEFNFTDAIDVLFFDEMQDENASNYHGIGLMHRVDFVVELENAILFVEVKDPSHPLAEELNIQKFHRKITEGKLAKSFADKYVSTFIYRWSEEKVDKPIHYISLVTLDEELLGNLTDEITTLLPPMNHSVPRWKKQFVNNCQVFNIESWNENFPKWPVRRVAT